MKERRDFDSGFSATMAVVLIRTHTNAKTHKGRDFLGAMEIRERAENWVWVGF